MNTMTTAMRALACLVTMVGCGVAVAAQPAASFGARDPAAIGCELLLRLAERAPTGTERQFYDWAQGYFAGRSAASGVTRRLPVDGDGRAEHYAFLLDYCQRNPAARFEAAVVALWERPDRP